MKKKKFHLYHDSLPLSTTELQFSALMLNLNSLRK